MFDFPHLLGSRIEEELRPIVGIVLASVSVELEAKRLGKSPETLKREDLPTLADSLEEQLKLVVGEELARAAAERVRNME